MRSRALMVAWLLGAPAFAGDQNACPVTRPSEHPFAPPAPLDQVQDDTFVVGTSGLWARVTNHWILNRTGNKLPYHSEIYTRYKVNDPPLVVVARRLDAPGPLVWAERAVGAWQSSGARWDDIAGRGGIGAMITSLPIPTAGCWEIAANYTPAGDRFQTLTYLVWVEDVGMPGP